MYHYNSPQLGGFGGATKEMFSADPDFAMGKIMTGALGVFGVREEINSELTNKLRLMN